MPLVISHRTNMGTMPENSLAGVDAALRDGADGVEIDVRATADGAIVLMHDATLTRTTGDPRTIASVSLTELATVRIRSMPGYAETEPVPTLAAVLDRVNGRGLLVVEVKDAGIERAVAAVIRDRGAESRCWIWAFDPAVASACRSALPAVPAALLSAPGSGAQYGYDSALNVAATAGLAAVSLHHSLVDDDIVRAAHARGLQIYTWSVDEPRDIRKVIGAGVDAVCGNFPLRIFEQIRDHGPGGKT